MTATPLGDAREVAAVLREIVAAYGPEALSDPATMSGWLADVFPGSPQTTRALIAAAQDQVGSALLERIGQGVDARTAARLVASSFAVTSMFQPDICAWTVGVIATALDLADGPPTMVVAPPQAQVTETPAPGWGNHAGVPVPFTGAQPQVRQDAQPVRKAAPVPWPRQPVAASGSRLGELRHSLDVTDLVFSHSGDRLATASVDATVKLWDGTGRQTGQMRHERAVAGIALSPDDTRLISRLRAPAIGHSRSVILWDAVTGQELSRLQHNTNVVSARFSRDGTRIATVSDEKIARLWSPEGEEMARLSHDRHVIAAGFSRDSSRLITLGQLSSVAVLWNAATGQFVAPIQHENHVRATAFSPDSTRLISFSSDGTTRLWETAAGLDAPWLERMDAWVIAFAPDSSVLATASAGTVVRLWDLATAGLIGGLPHDRPVTSLAYSPSGDSIATATGSLVRIWGTGSGRELLRMHDKERVTSIAFNADGTRLVTTNSHGAVRLWDTTSGQELAGTKLAIGYSPIARFSPDGNKLVTTGSDKLAKLWDSATGGLLASMRHSAPVLSAGFSPDSSLLATRAGKLAQLWAT